MIDRVALRADNDQLTHRLAGTPRWPELRAVYLDLTTLVDQLQGTLSEAAREDSESTSLDDARSALARLKAATRQAGFDIRLASEPALAFGLQAALQHAIEFLDCLDRIDAQKGPFAL